MNTLSLSDKGRINIPKSIQPECFSAEKAVTLRPFSLKEGDRMTHNVGIYRPEVVGSIKKVSREVLTLLETYKAVLDNENPYLKKALEYLESIPPYLWGEDFDLHETHIDKQGKILIPAEIRKKFSWSLKDRLSIALLPKEEILILSDSHSLTPSFLSYKHAIDPIIKLTLASDIIERVNRILNTSLEEIENPTKR